MKIKSFLEFQVQNCQKIITAIVLLISVILIAIAHVHTYNEPLERDLTTYAVIGHELLDGRQLYSDLWDHKPPAIHVTYAAAEWVAGYGPGAIYLLGVVAAIVTLFGVFSAATLLGGVTAGLLAALFWAVLSSSLTLQANQPNTEVFLNATLIWAFVFLLRMNAQGLQMRYALSVGSLFALGSLYKPIIIVSAAVLAIAYVLTAKNNKKTAIKQIAVILAVGITVWAAVLGYFGLSGRFDAFWDAVVVYNSAYSGGVIENIFNGLLPTHLLAPQMYVAYPLIAISLLGLALGSWRQPSREGVLLASLVISTAVIVALPGKFYSHYYQLWLPVLSIASAWVLSIICRLSSDSRPYLLHGMGATVVALLLYLQMPFYSLNEEEWSKRKYGDIFVESKRVAGAFEDLLEKDETFYEWGAETGLYYYSKRKPPSGLFYFYPLLAEPFSETLSQRVVNDLSGNPPEIFVLKSGVVIPKSHPLIIWASSHYSQFPDNMQPSVSYRFFFLKGGALEKRIQTMKATDTTP